MKRLVAMLMLLSLLPLAALAGVDAPLTWERQEKKFIVPGYAQCQIGENMIITIYATVEGKRTTLDKKGEEVERIELTADYGTYLVYK